jgi:hypothetical protein
LRRVWQISIPGCNGAGWNRENLGFFDENHAKTRAKTSIFARATLGLPTRCSGAARAAGLAAGLVSLFRTIG